MVGTGGWHESGRIILPGHSGRHGPNASIIPDTIIKAEQKNMNDTVVPQMFEQLISLDRPNLLDELERLWREDPSMLKRIAAYINERRRVRE